MLKDRIYFSTQNELYNIEMFIVNKPITFGHSQLKMSFTKKLDESTCFSLSSNYITKVIDTYNYIFKEKKMHLNEEFKELLEFTESGGEYLKTLILRTSASEDENIYKVHLLPFFTLSKDLCKKRFYNLHKIESDGGLIGWLGERETKADLIQKDFEKELISLSNYMQIFI